MKKHCEFCGWQGEVERGESFCPHCEKEGFLRDGLAPQKVVVYVRGGVVQNTWGADGIEVEIVDADNLENDGFSRKQIDAILAKAVKGLKLR
jgi:hypothetical protein